MMFGIQVVCGMIAHRLVSRRLSFGMLRIGRTRRRHHRARQFTETKDFVPFWSYRRNSSLKLKLNKTLFPLPLFVAFGVIASPGGLDANGGHTDRKTGIYHFHRGTNAPPGSPPLQSQSLTQVSSNSDVVATREEMENMPVAFQEPNAEAGAVSALSKLPWWVYLLLLGCGYLVWEIASSYYQNRKAKR
jgi:hypothetical protein